MIMDAHNHNIIEPGSYNRRLNQTLSKNGISSIQLETPDSEKLRSHQIIGETREAMTERQENSSKTRKNRKIIRKKNRHLRRRNRIWIRIKWWHSWCKKKAKEYETKIFELETDVEKRSRSYCLLRSYKKKCFI